MKKSWMILLAALLPLGGLTAQDSFQQAVGSAEQDLKNALQELEDFRQDIVRERRPLETRLNELRDEALAKRKDVERIQRLRDNRTVDLNSLKDEVAARKDENGYLSSLMGEYLRAFETRIHISEHAELMEDIKDAERVGNDINKDEAEKFSVQMRMVDRALKRAKDLIGGDIYSGSAVMPNGRYEAGSFVAIGPYVVFSSSEGGGIAQLRIGSNQPVVINAGGSVARAAETLAQGEMASLPIDFSLGNAVQLSATQDTVWETIQKGGVTMVPILGFAGIALIIAIYKWFSLAGVRKASDKDMQVITEAINAGDMETANQKARKIGGPVGNMLQTALANLHLSKPKLEELLYQKLIEAQPKMEKYLAVIALCAATAPLLGLLGTVKGMINTFKLITVFGTGDAKSLSSGISEALITTEFGLIVAIPALILHALLYRKAKGVIAGMEKTGLTLLNALGKKAKDNAA